MGRRLAQSWALKVHNGGDRRSRSKTVMEERKEGGLEKDGVREGGRKGGREGGR